MFAGYRGFAVASWPRDLEGKVELSEMREVDSTHDNSEVRLRRAMRSLSAALPGNAPPEISDALAGAFRRHHARRRAVRRASVAAAIFAVLLPAAVWLTRLHQTQPSAAKAPTPASVALPANTASVPAATASGAQPRKQRFHSAAVRRPKANAPPNDFVALPSSDQIVQGEDLRVIRLELTGRALQMVGAPVSEDIADRRLLADFVVGQDGTPYAVRLVR